jgi:TP901 family phage tail tape measure protein
MAAPINLQANVQIQNLSQMQREIQQATQNLKINMGGGNAARSLSALSQPLGRLTGQADEFSKSLDAANARVLAFGASVGIVNTLSNAFKSLVNSTIEVEKAITAISVVGEQFAGKSKQLSQGLFSIAKATGQSFEEVSKAALEFSRQGLQLEDTLQRTQDALILTRLTGLDASKSVDGLTASVNAFAKAGLSTTQILNKLAAVDQAFAVSSADLIEGFNRSAAVAQNAGVTFDELAGIITTLQQETSRGGAVIGNALKTIFTRLQDTSTLNQLQKLGVAVQDLEGNLLPARQILQNLATDVEGLGQITRAGIFKDVAGTFQINQLISLVGDLGKANSVTAKATQVSAGATNEAFTANQKLNQSLDAIINKVSLTGKQLGALLGEIGLGDNLKGILDGINSFLEGASNLLQGDDLGSRFAKGIVKGIGSVLSGPGIGLFLAIIAKLSFDLAKFGVQSLKTFFNIGQSAKEQQQVQESIVQTLIRNKTVLSQILNTQGGQNAQASAFLNILKQEEQVLQNIRTLAGGIAAPVIAQGYRSGSQGLTRLSAGGYLPAQEASDVRRGVGGASPSSKVVSIPNFAFGGGKRGTMIANTSEYIVPNYAGGGSAIFNQDMVKTMGLPAGAKKITASGGFIPNFSGGTKDNPLDVHQKYALLVNDLNSPRLNQLVSYKPRNEDKVYYKANVYGIGETENLQGIGQIDRFKSQFSTKFLEEKYKNLALEDIEKYANAVIGQPISPVAQVKLANKGSVPSLIGSIFESAIISALKDPDLIEAQLNRDDNAPFDFKGVAKSQFNKFFGIDENINFVEAKYADNDATRQSFASKIYRLESGKYIDKPKTEISTDLKGRWLSYNNLSSKKSIEAKEMYKSIAQDLGLDPIRDRTQINALMNKATGRSSSGYIPNFASDALQAAISRERSAGISASQIYVDQSPALKSAANPMGLMVANRRDEPAGGFQGVSRARREGVNPKTYGAANGFVPNFAPVVSDTDQVKASKGFGDLAGKFFVLQGALSFFEGGFIQAGSAAQKVNDALQTLTTALFAFQAVQQLSAKTETKNITIATNNISKFSQVIKDAKDKVQKWQKEFVAGGGSRASIVSRGGRLPSNTSFATRLSSSLGTSKLAGSLRNFVGNPLETISSTFKSFTGVALAATVALKGFNDIAALFYTRGDKLDSSLELLSSSASKASSSLSDIDKAVLKILELEEQ